MYPLCVCVCVQLRAACVFKGIIGEIMRPAGGSHTLHSPPHLPSLHPPPPPPPPSPTTTHTTLLLISFPHIPSHEPHPPQLHTALKFIECMCRCGLPLLLGEPVLEAWQLVIEENIPHAEETIRVRGVGAITDMCSGLPM